MRPPFTCPLEELASDSLWLVGGKGANLGELVRAGTPGGRDTRVGRPLTDLMVLNASFLVDRAGLSKFDRRLEKVSAEVGGQARFDCVGPLPPFSFVDLRI